MAVKSLSKQIVLENSVFENGWNNTEYDHKHHDS